MPKLPVLKPQEVVSRLEKLGFVEVRQRGAHKQFRHADGRGNHRPIPQGSGHLAGIAAQDRSRYWIVCGRPGRGRWIENHAQLHPRGLARKARESTAVRFQISNCRFQIADKRHFHSEI
jgi:predicted RNA binding protein YcfA (HicA-like mRNA interferase family)